MLGYQPNNVVAFPNSQQTSMAYGYGEDDFDTPEGRIAAQQAAMASGNVAIEAIPQPPQQQLAPRYDAYRLYQMYQAWETAKQPEIQEQYMASRYFHSKQWTDAEIRELKRRKQPITTKNRIKRKVEFLVGVEQRLRRDPKCYPRTPSAEQAAFVATASLRSVEDETKWQALASAAALDALVRGIGVIWQGAKIVKGRPEVRKSHIPADRFFYDPCSEQWDFSDARYLGEWQWMDMDEAIELMPFAEEMIETLGQVNFAGSMSALPQEFARSQNWTDWVNPSRRLIRLISIWYKCKSQWMFDYLVGPISLCSQDYDCLSPYVDPDEGIRQHPYTAWTPYIDESLIRYGVIRDMMPIQDGINKRTSKMMALLTQRQTQGEKGAVDDVDAMKIEAARPDGHLEFNKGFAFGFVDQSQQTQGQFELLQEDKAEIENLGPNPGLIGRGVENQSGRAILAQQNSGMTELSRVFENQREWKLNVYHKDWRLIRQFWTGERFIRVTSDPRAVEFLSVNRIVVDPQTNQLMGIENAIAEMDVDVILDEGPDTVTMREELLQALSNRPDVPLELILELSTLPDKDYVLKRLEEMKAPPPELAAIQEKMGMLEQMLKAAQIDTAQATAENTRATALKTMAEVGIAPPMLSGVFPIHYREPSMLDTIKMAGRQQAQMQSQAPEGGPQGPGGPMPGPEGAQQPNALLAPPQAGQMAPPGQEPQLGQPGGLPLGPGVGSQ